MSNDGKQFDGFDLLATNSLIGRLSDSIHPGLRRFEIDTRVAFDPEPGELLIVRVPQQQMLPANSESSPRDRPIRRNRPRISTFAQLSVINAPFLCLVPVLG